MSLQMQNMFQFSLYHYSSGDLVAYKEAPDSKDGVLVYEIFLFGQYPPSMWTSITVYDEAFTAPFAGPADWPFIENDPWVLLDVANIANIVVPDKATPYGLREVVKGVTDTNAVPVFGYFALSSILKRGVATGEAADVSCSFRNKVHCMGASVRSGHQYYATNLVDTASYNQIGLLETDYTQAMADNDNIVESTVGGMDYTYKIVAIFKEYAQN